ncbi:MAG: response regulator [Bradymonadales bacterium]|nr:response regulator [Bradymonadales bacterium]
MAIVLVVEESQTIRRVVEMALKGSGHDLIATTNGAQCRQAIYQYAIGLLLINYVLPDVSGLDLCREIKSNPATAHVPTIILGGSYAPFNENQAYASGADAVLIKPFLTEELLTTLNRLLAAAPAFRVPSAPRIEQPAYSPPPPQPVGQPAPYAPTPPPRGAPPAEQPFRGPSYVAPAPAVQPLPSGSYMAASAPAAQESYPSPATAGGIGRGPASREVSSSQRASYPPGPRYATGQQIPAPPRPPSGRLPRGFQPPTSQSPTSPSMRVPPPAAVPVAPPAPQRPAAMVVPPAEVRPAATPYVDQQELRAVLRELLPPIVRDALRQLFRDGLELRLRNYMQERVDQFLREEVRQLAIQVLQEEILKRQGRS